MIFIVSSIEITLDAQDEGFWNLSVMFGTCGVSAISGMSGMFGMSGISGLSVESDLKGFVNLGPVDVSEKFWQKFFERISLKISDYYVARAREPYFYPCAIRLLLIFCYRTK